MQNGNPSLKRFLLSESKVFQFIPSTSLRQMKEILLTKLRDRKTPLLEFRSAALEMADLLAAEAASNVPSKRAIIETPLSSAAGALSQGRIILVSILRAGLALLPAFLKLFPEAPIGFFGIRRDEKTAKPHLYYENIPPLQPSDRLFLLDPMIATAGSSLLALERLSTRLSPNQITLVGIISATPGIVNLKKRFPVVRVIVAAEDPELNAQAYIVPGLGDFGDRFFGTSV
jgi:uracil phosphoribosyltransferase